MKYKTVIKTISVCLLTTVFLSGCAERLASSGNNTLKKEIKKVIEINNKTHTLKDKFDFSIPKRNHINMTYDRNLKDVLKELSKLEQVDYNLQNNDIDIKIERVRGNSKVKIDSFTSLNNYLKSLYNKQLIIVKNRYKVNLPKVVRLIDYDSDSIENININLKINEVTLKKVLNIIQSISNYNIILDINKVSNITKTSTKNAKVNSSVGYINQNQTSKQLSSKINVTSSETDLKKVFLNKKIYFNETKTTIGKTIKYLSDSLNIYIDVEKANKKIIISTSKIKYFKLKTGDTKLTGD